MFWCHNRSLLNVYDVETVIITHRGECLQPYGWQWKICDELTIQFDSIQLDELLEVWRETLLYGRSAPYTRHCTSMYFTPHGVDFYFPPFDVFKIFRSFCFSSLLLSYAHLPPFLVRQPEMHKEVAGCCVCKYIWSVLSSKEQEHTWWTLKIEQPYFLITYVMYTRWKTNLMRRRPQQFTESLQNTFYNLIYALLLLFASNVHSRLVCLLHAFSEKCVRVDEEKWAREAKRLLMRWEHTVSFRQPMPTLNGHNAMHSMGTGYAKWRTFHIAAFHNNVQCTHTPCFWSQHSMRCDAIAAAARHSTRTA